LPSCLLSRFTTAQYTTSQANGFHAFGSCMPFFAALSFKKHAKLRCSRSQAALKSDSRLLLLPRLLPPGLDAPPLLLLLPLLLLGMPPDCCCTADDPPAAAALCAAAGLLLSM
jgi:hypothetical protein